MKAPFIFIVLLIVGFISNGSADNFSSISSKIVDSTSSKLFSNIKELCDKNSSPVTFKIFKKAENLLKSRVQLNLQKSFSKIIRSSSILKKNVHTLCDIDYEVNNYIIAVRPCFIRKVHYQTEEFSNSIIERQISSYLEIGEVVNNMCEEMKSAVQNAVDSKCFKQNLYELRECFKNNEFFKDYVALLADAKINTSPRDFPYYVITTSQPSFQTDLREIIDFRRCIINVLKSCEYSSLGFEIETTFLPSLERIQSLLY